MRHYLGINRLEANVSDVDIAQSDKLEKLAEDLLSQVRVAISTMTRLIRAGGFLYRFDALVKQERVEGLGQVLPDDSDIEIERGEVYSVAKSFLNDKRHGKTASNETDALAISAVSQLNREYGPRKELFILVSGASFLHTAVEKVREVLSNDRTDQPEIRDLVYWKLWFSILRRSSSARVPQMESVRQFAETIGPELEDLLWRNGQLNSHLRHAIRAGEGKQIKHLTDSFERYISDFDKTFEEILEPLFDKEWTLSILEDVLLPLKEVQEDLTTAVARIHSLLEELSRGVSSVQSLKALLLSLRHELERLVWILKSEEFRVGYEVEASEAEPAFAGGWSIEDASWKQRYRELLTRLEDGRKGSSQEVFKLLSEMAEDDADVFEKYIVASRAYLKERLVQEAEYELGCVPQRHRSDWEYSFTLGLLHEAKGELIQAENILRNLQRETGSPAVHLRLAKVLWTMFQKNNLAETLKEAAQNASLARRGLRQKSTAFKIQSAIVFYDIVSHPMLQREFAKEIQRGRLELENLVSEAERESLQLDLDSLRRLKEKLV